ncbi:MAG TPA: hypothetical protein VFK38_06780 [Candidatus Limnocylindrales bacterium]|nr:hypothetical protein [Candidatus Limnocylindrales bacterium]
MTARPDPSAHPAHDQLLVARAAAGDLAEHERVDAQALLDACAACRSLYLDLRSLSASLATDLPVPRRPRDFRLTDADAARLRGSPIDRLVRWLSGPSLGILQPLASAALAIGLALVVINSLPLMGAASGPAPLGVATEGAYTGTGAPPESTSQDGGGPASPGTTPDRLSSPAASPAVGAAAPSQVPSDASGGVVGVAGEESAPPAVGKEQAAPQRQTSPAGPPLGLMAGLGLIVAAALLLTLRAVARGRARR